MCESQAIQRANTADRSAVDRVFPLIYAELRRLAGSYLRYERQNYTLQPTALVHEAYLRLCRTAPGCGEEAHLKPIAARVMRQVLVDFARRRNSYKRSGALKRELNEADAGCIEKPIDILHIEDALKDLERLDTRKAQLIELRFFTGLTAEESAAVLGLDVGVVRSQLRLAQAWLERQLDRR